MSEIRWAIIATATFASLMLTINDTLYDEVLSGVACYFYGVAMCFISVKGEKK